MHNATFRNNILAINESDYDLHSEYGPELYLQDACDDIAQILAEEETPVTWGQYEPTGLYNVISAHWGYAHWTEDNPLLLMLYNCAQAMAPTTTPLEAFDPAGTYRGELFRSAVQTFRHWAWQNNQRAAAPFSFPILSGAQPFNGPPSGSAVWTYLDAAALEIATILWGDGEPVPWDDDLYQRIVDNLGQNWSDPHGYLAKLLQISRDVFRGDAAHPFEVFSQDGLREQVTLLTLGALADPEQIRQYEQQKHLADQVHDANNLQATPQSYAQQLNGGPYLLLHHEPPQPPQDGSAANARRYEMEVRSYLESAIEQIYAILRNERQLLGEEPIPWSSQPFYLLSVAYHGAVPSGGAHEVLTSGIGDGWYYDNRLLRELYRQAMNHTGATVDPADVFDPKGTQSVQLINAVLASVRDNV